MSRWHIPTGFLTVITLAALTLLAGCPEDPAEAMLKQARAGGAPSTPPATTPPTTPPGGAPGTPAAGAPPGTPGAPAGKPGERGVLPPGQPAAEPAKEAGPKITIDIKSIKAPYPRYSGKGRYDMTLDIAVEPPEDEAVWKFTALDAAGKAVGVREEQLVLLREKPRTIMLNDFYCTTAPTSVKMEIALDKDGKPKTAKAAGDGGVGDQNTGGNGGGAPPGGAGNNPPPGGGGRGAGGGGGAPPGGGGGAAPPGGGSGGSGGGGEGGGEGGSGEGGSGEGG